MCTGNGEVRRLTSSMARMLEDAEVERLFMRLDTPGNCMLRLDVNPAYQVGLSPRSESPSPATQLLSLTYLAVYLELFHASHGANRSSRSLKMPLLNWQQLSSEEQLASLGGVHVPTSKRRRWTNAVDAGLTVHEALRLATRVMDRDERNGIPGSATVADGGDRDTKLNW